MKHHGWWSTDKIDDKQLFYDFIIVNIIGLTTTYTFQTSCNQLHLQNNPLNTGAK